jgi:hypothetical protein
MTAAGVHVGCLTIATGDHNGRTTNVRPNRIARQPTALASSMPAEYHPLFLLTRIRIGTILQSTWTDYSQLL